MSFCCWVASFPFKTPSVVARVNSENLFKESIRIFIFYDLIIPILRTDQETILYIFVCEDSYNTVSLGKS